MTNSMLASLVQSFNERIRELEAKLQSETLLRMEAEKKVYQLEKKMHELRDS